MRGKQLKRNLVAPSIPYNHTKAVHPECITPLRTLVQLRKGRGKQRESRSNKSNNRILPDLRLSDLDHDVSLGCMKQVQKKSIDNGKLKNQKYVILSETRYR